MAFHDDVVDSVTADITHIGLLTSSDPGDEITGDGYTRLAPTYAAASSGEADITATLEFDGPANEGPVTHLLFVRDNADDVVRPAASPQSFNSDGRLDLVSAPVTSAFPD